MEIVIMNIVMAYLLINWRIIYRNINPLSAGYKAVELGHFILRIKLRNCKHTFTPQN